MNARSTEALVVALGIGVSFVVAGCQPSCPAKTLADIEARYAAAALKACRGYPSLAECPDAPALREQRRKEEEAAECR
jgi:hypothetical protein